MGGWNVVHQCGQRELEATAGLYSKLAIAARVTPFIDDMPGMLAATDLAISRAGGTTLAEFAAAHVPAILLPYPRATDDHQWHNAEIFRAAALADSSTNAGLKAGWTIVWPQNCGPSPATGCCGSEWARRPAV